MQFCYTTTISHFENLARLLLDFGVVNTTDDACEQQRFRASHSIYNLQLTTPAVRRQSARLTHAAINAKAEQERSRINSWHIGYRDQAAGYLWNVSA